MSTIAASPPVSVARPVARSALGERVLAGLIGAGCLTVLGIAAWLQPSPTGAGTHTQLGLPPCGWVVAFGKPCPTCGMTTAFADAAHGRYLAALTAQPMGLLLALITAAVVWPALHVALTGSRLGHALARLVNGRVLWALGGLLLAGWVDKLATWPGR